MSQQMKNPTRKKSRNIWILSRKNPSQKAPAMGNDILAELLQQQIWHKICPGLENSSLFRKGDEIFETFKNSVEHLDLLAIDIRNSDRNYIPGIAKYGVQSAQSFIRNDGILHPFDINRMIGNSFPLYSQGRQAEWGNGPVSKSRRHGNGRSQTDFPPYQDQYHVPPVRRSGRRCQENFEGKRKKSRSRRDINLYSAQIVVPMIMPISEGKIDQRLAQITAEFRHIFTSPLLVGGVAVNRALCLISGTFRKYLFLRNYGTLFHSNLSTFKENRYELCGNPVERIMPIAGLLQGSCSIGIINVSYNGKMGVAITADKNIISGPDELERVIDHVISEINEIGEINLMKNEGEMSLV
ncbi:hypothetical protein Fcan01_18915 [Folsomia candida]|uniref:O-acyltransferase WSD1 C-terminal domain-containing protein n=1 Tax=Folsomia candida TaxID=158441 RepID=A0A226DM60_FOLCA|nr:hypothetical protein Fcan01_18915 [Folsomia candida]